MPRPEIEETEKNDAKRQCANGFGTERFGASKNGRQIRMK